MSMLSSTVVVSHTWLLSASNVAGETDKQNSKLYLIYRKLKLSSHKWLAENVVIVHQQERHFVLISTRGHYLLQQKWEQCTLRNSPFGCGKQNERAPHFQLLMDVLTSLQIGAPSNCPHPFKNHLVAKCGPGGLMNAEPHCFSELSWGSRYMVYSKPFTPQGETRLVVPIQLYGAVPGVRFMA